MHLPDCLHLAGTPAYPICEVRHPCATARIAVNGAHLMEWTPAGEQPVLYLSPEAVLESGKPIRGGIPVCWPWFGPHADPRRPMHGYARILPWRLAKADADTAGVHLVFELEPGEAAGPWWEPRLAARLEMRIGMELDVVLATRNIGDEPLLLEEALHTYLTVGDIHRVRVSGLEGAAYLDTVGERVMRRQVGDIAFAGEVDRQYASFAAVAIADPALGRTLVVEKEGSATTVVWNPWIEKSKRLADLPDEAYLGFLCVEAANAGDGAVDLAPGMEHHLRTRVRLA
jgi:glucose-6-phosphate 1-epimerase